MKIEPKHIFTGGSSLPQGAKSPALTKMFEQKAVIPMTGRSLANRVQKPASITEKGKALTARVIQWITKPSSSRGSR